MDAKPAAHSVLWVARGLRKGLSLLVARVKALRTAVGADNFRMAQRLRLALPVYVRHLETPLGNDVVRLFEVSGLWVRNLALLWQIYSRCFSSLIQDRQYGHR
jgi:hypothetical protein